MSILVSLGSLVRATESIRHRDKRDPRVNIQNFKGKAKPYQVRQVIQAIDRLEIRND